MVALRARETGGGRGLSGPHWVWCIGRGPRLQLRQEPQGTSDFTRTECCQSKPMWDRLEKLIDDFFEGITLADLLKDGGV